MYTNGGKMNAKRYFLPYNSCLDSPQNEKITLENFLLILNVTNIFIIPAVWYHCGCIKSKIFRFLSGYVDETAFNTSLQFSCLRPNTNNVFIDELDVKADFP